MLDAVDGLDGFQNIFKRVVDRVFAGFQCQTFVAHVLQGDDLAADVLLCQFLAGDGLVLCVVGTVGTTVHAIVRQVQRGEHHDAVAVEFLLDFAGQTVDFLHQFRVVTFQEYGSFAVGESLAQAGLFNDGTYQFLVLALALGIFQGIQNFFVADKFLCLLRINLVHSCNVSYNVLPG